MINDKFTCIGLLSIFVIIVGLLLYKLYNNKLIVQENYGPGLSDLGELLEQAGEVPQLQESVDNIQDSLLTILNDLSGLRNNLNGVDKRVNEFAEIDSYEDYQRILANIETNFVKLASQIANLQIEVSESSVGLSEAISELSKVPNTLQTQINLLRTTFLNALDASDLSLRELRSEDIELTNSQISSINQSIGKIQVDIGKALGEINLLKEKDDILDENIEANKEKIESGMSNLRQADEDERLARIAEDKKEAKIREEQDRDERLARIAANNAEAKVRTRVDEELVQEDKDERLARIAANTKEMTERKAKNDLLDQEDRDERLARIAANTKERENRIAKDILLDEEDRDERKSRIYKDKLIDDEILNLKDSWNDMEISIDQKLKLYGNKLTQIQDIIDNSDKQQELRLNDFEKVADDLNAKKMNIGQQYRDFSTSIKELGQFHDNYQKELESILDRRYNLSNAEYKLRKDKQSQKLDKIEQTLRNLKPQQNQNTNKSFKSIKNDGSGNILNVAKILKHDNKYNVFINDYDEQGGFETKCLNTVDPEAENNNGIIGINTPSLQPCNGAKKNQNFLIKKINNSYEYNEIIGLDDTEINKSRPEDEEYIKYPFYVVTPKEEVNRGWCLNIDDNKNASIQSCSSTSYQRFTPLYSEYETPGSC